VQTGEKAFDDELRPQIEASDLADDAWLQIFLGIAHGGIIQAINEPEA
jgi:hypothetical protein